MKTQKWGNRYFPDQCGGGDEKLGPVVSSPGGGGSRARIYFIILDSWASSVWGP